MAPAALKSQFGSDQLRRVGLAAFLNWNRGVAISRFNCRAGGNHAMAQGSPSKEHLHYYAARRSSRSVSGDSRDDMFGPLAMRSTTDCL